MYMKRSLLMKKRPPRNHKQHIFPNVQRASDAFCSKAGREVIERQSSKISFSSFIRTYIASSFPLQHIGRTCPDDMLPVGSEETSANKKSIPSILEYFPELKGNLTEVEWAHAVNSISLLEKALSDKKVMMLEGDVVLGTLAGKNEIIPIMAHPPITTSDLSLEMFLKAAITAQKDKKKGIKLDFKSTESFQVSTKVIDHLITKINFPVLLNADILSGPIDSDVKPVDSEIFLNLSVSKYSKTTLSLGWTTRFGPGMEGIYTKEQLNSMRVAVEKNKVMQPITLCVRAGIAAKTPGIKDLVDEIDKFQKSESTSVTIWMSSDSDPVDVPKLKDLILLLKKSKVLLDVPKFIRDELALDTNSRRTPISAAQGALVALLTSISAIFTNVF